MADDLQSWTEVGVGVLAVDRIDWTIGGVARIRDSLGSVYDRRARTDVEFTLSDLASVTLGYILLNRARTDFGPDFGWDHRLHAGLTYPLLRRGVRVEGTMLYERHIGRRDSGDFNRYRQQVELERPGARVSPWLHQSLAFERRGLRAVAVPRRVPLASPVRALLHRRLPVRAAQDRRHLAAAACRPLGMESGSGYRANRRPLIGGGGADLFTLRIGGSRPERVGYVNDSMTCNA